MCKSDDEEQIPGRRNLGATQPRNMRNTESACVNRDGILALNTNRFRKEELPHKRRRRSRGSKRKLEKSKEGSVPTGRGRTTVCSANQQLLHKKCFIKTMSNEIERFVWVPMFGEIHHRRRFQKVHQRCVV